MPTIHGSDIDVTTSKLWFLWQTPQLFKSWEEVEELERKVSWPELFYDLLLVAAVLQLGNFLKENITIQGAAMVAILYMSFFHNWYHLTIYITRFHTEDMLHSLCFFLQGLGTLGMTVHIHDAFSQRSLGGFAGCMVFAKLVFFLMYSFVFKFEPTGKAQATCASYMVGCVWCCSCWIISIFTPLPVTVALWVVGLFGDWMAYTWLLFLHKRHLSDKERRKFLLPINVEHVTERVGLLVMIVMGEAIIGLTSTPAVHSPEYFGLLAMGFLLVSCLQLLYYDSQPLLPEDHALRRTRIRGLTFTYIHPVAQICMLFIGVSIKWLLLHPFDKVPIGVTALLCGGLAGTVLCFHIIRLLCKGDKSDDSTDSEQKLAPSAVERLAVKQRIRRLKKKLWVFRLLSCIIVLLPLVCPQPYPVSLLAGVAGFTLLLVLLEAYLRSHALVRLVVRTVRAAGHLAQQHPSPYERNGSSGVSPEAPTEANVPSWYHKDSNGSSGRGGGNGTHKTTAPDPCTAGEARVEAAVQRASRDKSQSDAEAARLGEGPPVAVMPVLAVVPVGNHSGQAHSAALKQQHPGGTNGHAHPDHVHPPPYHQRLEQQRRSVDKIFEGGPKRPPYPTRRSGSHGSLSRFLPRSSLDGHASKSRERSSSAESKEAASRRSMDSTDDHPTLQRQRSSWDGGSGRFHPMSPWMELTSPPVDSPVPLPEPQSAQLKWVIGDRRLLPGSREAIQAALLEPAASQFDGAPSPLDRQGQGVVPVGGVGVGDFEVTDEDHGDHSVIDVPSNTTPSQIQTPHFPQPPRLFFKAHPADSRSAFSPLGASGGHGVERERSSDSPPATHSHPRLSPHSPGYDSPSGGGVAGGLCRPHSPHAVPELDEYDRSTSPMPTPARFTRRQKKPRGPSAFSDSEESDYVSDSYASDGGLDDGVGGSEVEVLCGTPPTAGPTSRAEWRGVEVGADAVR